MTTSELIDLRNTAEQYMPDSAEIFHKQFTSGGTGDVPSDGMGGLIYSDAADAANKEQRKSAGTSKCRVCIIRSNRLVNEWDNSGVYTSETPVMIVFPWNADIRLEDALYVTLGVSGVKTKYEVQQVQPHADAFTLQVHAIQVKELNSAPYTPPN